MKTDTYGVITRARIAKNLTIEISSSPVGLTVEWIGDLPPKLNARQMARYVEARDKALAGLAERIGGNVVCVEG